MKTIVSFIKTHGFALLAGCAALFVFCKIVIAPFTDWNFAAESVSFDFINFFWHDNFRFFRLPHFNWHTDYMLYPYGIDATFFFWAFEMNIFGSWMRALDIAPWGQCYYLFSLVVTFFGSYALLWHRKGRGWAIFFAFVLTFCNYAAICKYPGHFTHCIVHWGILSVLLDLILVEKFCNGEYISASYALMRVLVLLLCLGLELGYIAGFACFSFFVTCAYLFLSKVAQTKSLAETFQWLFNGLQNVARTFTATRLNYLLVSVIVLVSWIYLPIVVQIMANTPSQREIALGVSNPLRIFHPILPDCNPATTWAAKKGVFYIGTVDTIYAWSAGWSALLFCYFGIVLGGMKGVWKWIPFALSLSLALLMNQFPLITYFPAFKYARFAERFSPYLICMLLIPLVQNIPSGKFLKNHFRICLPLAIPIVLLWVIEMGTAYFCADTVDLGNRIHERFASPFPESERPQPVCKTSNTFSWVERYRMMPFSAEYRRAVEEVNRLPGKALFFMPFSANGGDGRGLTEFAHCAAHQMQFAARCGKKMNGCYVGRMFPDLYLKDFNHIHWSRYFRGDIWTADMWTVLKRFLSSADFAAVVIDKTALSPCQVDDIVQHLGRPIVSFDSHGEQYSVIPVQMNGIQ